jgi:hypothetical protein
MSQIQLAAIHMFNYLGYSCDEANLQEYMAMLPVQSLTSPDFGRWKGTTFDSTRGSDLDEDIGCGVVCCELNHRRDALAGINSPVCGA